MSMPPGSFLLQINHPYGMQNNPALQHFIKSASDALDGEGSVVVDDKWSPEEQSSDIMLRDDETFKKMIDEAFSHGNTQQSEQLRAMMDDHVHLSNVVPFLQRVAKIRPENQRVKDLLYFLGHVATP